MESVPDLATIVEENEAALLRYAYRFLKNRENARDAVQEAFVRFHKATVKKPLGFKSQISNPTAWLYTITRNLCLDQLRSKRHKSEVLLGEDHDIDDFAGHAESPHNEVAKTEEMKMMKCAINNLDDRYREVLVLKMEHEKSYKEIAEIMNISVSNVGFILHNAIKQLKTEMQKYR